MFGAGGGTNSYREVEDADLIVLWGSNARETHPIFFHHVLKAVHKGARLYAIDPRRTSSAEWADVWLGLDVGSDIALANAIAREIIDAGLEDERFIGRATEGFEAYRTKVDSYTLDYAERETGVPAETIRELAHAFAKADKAMICWTLGITEHHNAVDNVLALISLVLLTGHVGRYGSGVNPLRGQNNVQGGGDMGALPDRLTGFQHVENDAIRARFDAEWGVAVPPKRGWHLSGMFDAMERGDLTAVYCIGENPVQSEADQKRAIELLSGLDFLVVQDLFLTKTAALADVVLPATAAWAESEGTVTNSERRVQRVRKAVEPPRGRPRRPRRSSSSSRTGWAAAGASPIPRRSGTRSAACRRSMPGCPTRGWRARAGSSGRAGTRPTRASCTCTAGSGRTRCPATGCRSCRSTTIRRSTSSTPTSRSGSRPGAGSTRTTPASRRRATRRRCAAASRSTCRPRTSRGFGLVEGEVVRVVSRRGQVEVAVRLDESLRPGLTFMTMHFQDEVAVNLLTIDATDPKSGTAEFKATAIRIEKLGVPAGA